VQAIAQFCVLFAGPIGLVLLLGFLILRWARQSRRREPLAPRFEMIPGAAEPGDEEPGETPPAAGRPPLRLVSRGLSGPRHEGSGGR